MNGNSWGILGFAVRVFSIGSMLTLTPLDGFGHDVADDTACVGLSAPEGSTVWNLVNSCPYVLDVVWCDLDGLTDEPSCGGDEYYGQYDILDPDGSAALVTPVTQDIGLAVAACRVDLGAGFEGIDIDSLEFDGGFVCLVGQRVSSPFGLVAAADDEPGTFTQNDEHCIESVARDGVWGLVNNCSYEVDVAFCFQRTCGGVS